RIARCDLPSRWTEESGLVARALVGNHPGEQLADLGLAVAPASAERADRAALAGLRPPGDRLRVDPEHRGGLCWREQRLRLHGSHAHRGPPRASRRARARLRRSVAPPAAPRAGICQMDTGEARVALGAICGGFS